MRKVPVTLAVLSVFLTSCWVQSSDARRPITSIWMQRSGCYGVCPVYSVKIDRNGNVTFSGEKFVQCTGKRTSRVSPADFDEVARIVEKIGFQDLQSKYWSEVDGCRGMMSDQDAVDIIVSRGSDKKRVSYYYGCKGVPAAGKFISLSNAIDKAGNTGQWIGKREFTDWMHDPQPRCHQDV